MVGTPFAGFARGAGTEQVAQRLATSPAAGEDPSLCYSTVECLQATQLSPLLPLPCPCPCPSLFQGSPSSLLALQPSTRRAGSAQTPAHTVQTDTSRAQGHMPTAVELTRAHVSCLLHSHSPAPPEPGACGSQRWVMAGSRSIASSLWVPGGAGSQHGAEPSHRSPTGG